MRKWKFLAISIIVSANAIGATPPRAPPSGNKLVPSELATWPRMRATDFGCMLEKRFGVRDNRYGCSAKFERIDWGDVCEGVKFHSGPELPPRVASTLPSLIEGVTVEWQRGEVRNVWVRFTRKVSQAEANALFGGAGKFNEQCSINKSCISFRGAEYQGAADFECDKLPAK